MEYSGKRIFKNSIAMYFRMLFMMMISLYTSRVTLLALGVSDFGIYQVVGGVVIVFSFLNMALASATQRFLNYEKGKGNISNTKEIFFCSVVMHLIVSCLILLLGETIGLWFVNTYLMVPPERMHAANCVYQLSLIAFVFSIMNVPCNAAINANERMTAYAYISVLDGLLKLCLISSLEWFGGDLLIIYAIMMTFSSLFVMLVYWFYCIKMFPECHISFHKPDLNRLRHLSSFSSWSLLGGVRSIGHTHGISIISNLFFGVAINATFGITNQVTSAANNMVNSFLVTLNPQLVQLYAGRKLDVLQVLMVRGSKIALSLVSLFAIPLIIETPFVLFLWLKNVPDYTVIFVRLSLLAVLIQCYAQVLQTIKSATGEVKNYQIILAAIGLMHLPLTFILFKLGLEPYYSMIVYCIIISVIQVIRIIFGCHIVLLPIISFIIEIAKMNLAILISTIIPFLLHCNMEQSLIRLLLVVVTYILSFIPAVLFVGFSRVDRSLIISFFSKIRYKQNNYGWNKENPER